MSARVGLFGLLGSGNLGNDGSLEAVLGYLRAEHPDATVSAFCGGPAVVSARYGIPATRLNWYADEYQTASGLRSIAMKAFGKLVDVVRTAAWVRRQDVVFVPGMGVLEATLPLRPWGFPYALFLLSAAGRVFGTKVALVSVGADRITVPATRFLVRQTARLAAYRSYRDELSRTAMRSMGVPVDGDAVYPDLAFSLPVPTVAEDPRTVGVGVMAYYGGNDDRADGERIYRSYVDAMTRFVRHLVARGRPVRLFIGDQIDTAVVEQIQAAVAAPPGQGPPVGARGGRGGAVAGRDAVPQRVVRAEAREADAGDRVREEKRRADGRDGPGRVLPGGPRGRRRPADHAVRGTGPACAGAAPDTGRAQRGERTAAQAPVRRAVRFAVPCLGGPMKAMAVPSIAGAYLFQPTPHRDDRGFFSRTFDADVARSVGIEPETFVQDSVSRSYRGVLRGMHLRSGDGEAKLVRCSFGEVFDVVVDLRPESPTFRNREFLRLSGETQESVYIPAGCAHGFQALSEIADVSYRIDRVHNPDEDVAIAYDDPELAIPWPLPAALVSERDSAAGSLAEALEPLG